MDRRVGRRPLAVWTTGSTVSILVLLLAGAVWMVAQAAPDPVGAAAPTVHRTAHGFDPDWLEVSRILNTKCVGCHRPESDYADLSSYEALMAGQDVSGAPLVTPGRPEESQIWERVVWGPWDGHEGEEPLMPPEREDWLTAGQLATLHRWIRRGARKVIDRQAHASRPLMEIDFPSAQQCKVCHPRQYEQWSRSMHAYAQHSPVFEAFMKTMLERTSGTLGTFCSRCHTPLGTLLGESASLSNVHRSQLSMEGVTCVVCHRIKRPYYKASVRMAIQPGELLDACVYGPFSDPATEAMGTHAAEKGSHLTSSAFCGSCHDVTLPTGVRLEEAFSEWQNSPAARQGITCQHCHMGPIPGIATPEDERPWGRAATVPGVDPEQIPLRRLSNHSFAGPDYSLLPDTEFPHKLDWMYEVDYRKVDQLTPYQKGTLEDLRRKNRRQLRMARAQRYELLRNAAEISMKAPRTARVGDRITIHVDVTSKTAGHNFPTGFTSERQAWVEVTLLAPDGSPVFLSGDRDENGDLRDEHSHGVQAGRLPFDRYLLNFQSKFVALTNRGTERPVIIPVNRHLSPLTIVRPAQGVPAALGRPLDFRIAKGSLPPLATRGQDYPVRLPNRPGDYALRVRLNYRHLPPVLLDKIGIPHLKPLLEVVVIDEREATIHVSE